MDFLGDVIAVQPALRQHIARIKKKCRRYAKTYEKICIAVKYPFVGVLCRGRVRYTSGMISNINQKLLKLSELRNPYGQDFGTGIANVTR
jgi:hypothetical protein